MTTMTMDDKIRSKRFDRQHRKTHHQNLGECALSNLHLLLTKNQINRVDAESKSKEETNKMDTCFATYISTN